MIQSKRNKLASIGLGLMLAMGLSAMPAHAQGLGSDGMPLGPDTIVGDGFTTGAAADELGKTFGTASGIDHWIGAPAFTSRDGATIAHFGSGYIYNQAGATSAIFWANLVLPQGAFLNGYRLYYCDTDAATPTIFLTAYHGTTVPGVTDLFVSAIPVGVPGCTSYWQTTNHTIDYRPATNTPRYYVLNVRLNAIGTTIRFKGVRAFWHRQVTPAPVVASFGDVPTTHWAFKWIEALAATGISSGCGGINYCPNTPVTRAQIAVMLSQALGL